MIGVSFVMMHRDEFSQAAMPLPSAANLIYLS